jgi:hypothetical protein
LEILKTQKVNIEREYDIIKGKKEKLEKEEEL